jgi:hypothetical protein
VKKEKGGGKALNLKLNMELSKIKQPQTLWEVKMGSLNEAILRRKLLWKPL